MSAPMVMMRNDNELANHRKAILITYPVEQAIKEAISLADAAGYSIIETVTQRQITRSRFGIGRGKAEEVKDIVKEIRPDIIIFDETIKPTQVYNLASLCNIEIIDRERLILEIFEKRASTAESQIQIKLAQLRYDMARAREMVRLARAGEQPGFYGLGKYEADIYFLDIRRRAAMLKKRLEKEETRRQLHRNQRAKAGLPTVSLAGYTSAGKTTLFNKLTGETKVTGQGVFTTLSTFTRAIELQDCKVLIDDTVGFVSKLPAYMIDAFKSTLDELTYANLVLLVIDISEPADEIKRKFESSLDVINEFEIPYTKIIYVLNKVDLTTVEDAFRKAEELGILNSKRMLAVSAKTSYNIDQLKNLIRAILFETKKVKDKEENKRLADEKKV
jgi:GTP-binding protein HflX